MMVLLLAANGMLKISIVLSMVITMKTMGKVPMMPAVYVEEDRTPQVPPRLPLSPLPHIPLSVPRPLQLNVQMTQRDGLIVMGQFVAVNGMVKVLTVHGMATAMQTLASQQMRRAVYAEEEASLKKTKDCLSRPGRCF